MLRGGSSISKQGIKSNHDLNKSKLDKLRVKNKLPKRAIIHRTLMKYLLPALLKGRAGVFTLLKDMASLKWN